MTTPQQFAKAMAEGLFQMCDRDTALAEIEKQWALMQELAYTLDTNGAATRTVELLNDVGWMLEEIWKQETKPTTQGVE